MKCLLIIILGIVVCGTLCNGQGDGGGDAGGVTMVTGDGNQSGNKCYSCDSTTDGCDNDNFDVPQASIVTCSGKCLKYWSVGDGEPIGSVRGCATIDGYVDHEEAVCKNKCESASIDSVEVCIFCCNDDLCNSAGSVAINTAVIFSVTAVSALLVMIF